MRRFFGSSSIVRRIPPGAPSFVKEIPTPRTTKTTADVAKVLGHEVAPQAGEVTSSGTRDSKYLKSMMPAQINSEQLASPQGVWYHVERSRSGNLPVYLDYNNAGGVWTEVRKVSGNVGALRNDLKKALDVTNAEIWVKNAANAVVIKGDRRAEVKSLLKGTF